MKSKSQEVRELIAQGKMIEALRIAKTFRIGDKELLDGIKRGWDAYQNPAFYTQIGKKPEKLVDYAYDCMAELMKEVN